MSWNITTFILHSKRFRFLATDSKPFLKYCVNNSIIPICFLLVYFLKRYHMTRKWNWFILLNSLELLQVFRWIFLLIAFSFVYFFTADRRIVRTFKPVLTDFDNQKNLEKHRGCFCRK